MAVAVAVVAVAEVAVAVAVAVAMAVVVSGTLPWEKSEAAGWDKASHSDTVMPHS